LKSINYGIYCLQKSYPLDGSCVLDGSLVLSILFETVFFTSVLEQPIKDNEKHNIKIFV